MARGPLERGREEGLVEGVFSEEAPSSFFYGGLAYVCVRVVNPTLLMDIILVSSMEEEAPCKDTWSINCCWDGKGSVKTAGAGLFFKIY